METMESLGYLKGLLDGLDVEENSKEAKIYNAIIDVLTNLTEDVEDMTEGLELLAEQIDDVDEDLASLEEFVYDEDDCDCDCDCCCGDEEYEIECPACGECIAVDEETIMEGDFECPACGEHLEFEVEFEDEDSAE